MCYKKKKNDDETEMGEESFIFDSSRIIPRLPTGRIALPELVSHHRPLETRFSIVSSFERLAKVVPVLVNVCVKVVTRGAETFGEQPQKKLWWR